MSSAAATTFQHWHRQYRRWRLRQMALVDQAKVLKAIDEDAGLSAAYMWMICLAAGIAILGLLTNSAAVIIGAMLVSPLMSPIVGLGTGIATLNIQRLARALITLLVGLCLAIALSYVVVMLSPIKEATPEILARTRPNLFDLLIAAISGLAGGFALIRGKGGTVVGVAIATALMPPTTVIGFGLAVQNMEIAQGAGLLLATNMAAIALAAAVTAVWYGFSQDAYGHALAWELVLGAVLLLPLGVPLTNTLREVANETWMVHTARQTVQQHFSDQKMQVLGLEVSIRSGQGNRPLVQVMFASENLEDKQTEALRKSLESKLSPRADIAVAHFPFGSQPRDARTGSALVNQIGTTGMAAEAALLQPSPKDVEWSLPVLAREINPDTKSAKWVLGPSDVSLAVMRDWESALSLRYPDWQIALIPAFQNELELSFEQGQVDTDAIDPEQLKAAVWALQRWGVTDIAIEGHASTAGRANRWLAQQRAESVRELLAVEHLAVRLQLAYPVPGQAELERRYGRKAFEKAVIRPLVRRAGSSV